MWKRYNHILILSLLLLVYACERDEGFNHIYLDDHQHLRSNTSTNIIANFQLLESLHPAASQLAGNVAYGSKVYSISYNTIFQGEEVIASGLVSIPDARGTFPIISFQNGTNTCNSSAPSSDHDNMLFSLLTMNSGNGFIIVIPDYIGFGESKEYLHPYYHKESTTRVIRDMILAVEELADYNAGLELSKELFLMGYSQGGWASLAALKDMENDPLPGYILRSASCGAGAYDLIDFTHYILSRETYSKPFYLPYYIESRRQNGIMDEDLNLFFKEPYAGMIPGLFDGTLCNNELNSNFTTNLPELLSEELLTAFDSSEDFITLRNELTGSGITAWKVNSPVLITHSNGDQSVPIKQSFDLLDNLLAAGTDENNIHFTEIDGLLHNEAAVQWGINSLIWFINQ